MLKLSKGFKVARNEELHEGYKIESDGSFIANVNADKVSDVLHHFIALHNVYLVHPFPAVTPCISAVDKYEKEIKR